MRNKIFFSIIIVTLVLLGGFYFSQKQSTKEMSGVTEARKLSVVATFYPLEEFARVVGGEYVMVTGIVPAGAEPHEYEPTQRDILAAYGADVFLLSGAGIDPWAEKIRPDLEQRGIAVVQMSDQVSILSGTSEDGAGTPDPHFWLDPVWAQQEVEAIRLAFIARDVKHREAYTENAAQYIRELQKLDTAYREGLNRCTLDTIVTSHYAFAYLAQRYGFDTLSVSGLSPEAEPSPRRLAELAEAVRARGVKYIFFETLVSPKVAQTLAEATGTQTLIFNPLEGVTDRERAQGKNYLTLMRENLANLQTALVCQP